MRLGGVPQASGHPHGRINPTAIVLHRTYGGWPGDYSVGISTGVNFHFLVGKDENKWVQFLDTNDLAWHCGNNSWSVGIEFEGRNEQPLTDWQVRAGAWIIAGVSNAHAIPRNYYDGRRVNRYVGILPHASVSGSDHTDTITRSDFQRMETYWTQQSPPVEAPSPPPPVTGVDIRALKRWLAGDLLNNGFGNVPTLTPGMPYSWYVIALQRALNIVADRGLKEDGVYGPGTQQAVSDFQRFFGLTVDGVFGAQSRFVMCLALIKIRDGNF